MTAPDDALDAFVLATIKAHTADDPIPRPVLLWSIQANGWMIGDRRMRKIIARLRKTPAGAMISTAPGGGYYMSGDRSQMNAALVRDERRFHRLAARIAAQRRLAGLECAPALLEIARGEA